MMENEVPFRIVQREEKPKKIQKKDKNIILL